MLNTLCNDMPQILNGCWMTYGLTAMILGSQAVMFRFSYVFNIPDWFLVIANFLIILSIWPIADCVALLLIVVSIVNEARIQEFEDQEPVNPTFPDSPSSVS